MTCYPATACTVAGLSAQPPCYWNVSTLAGSGVAGWADGQGTDALFNDPHGVSVDPVSANIFVGEYANQRVRRISPIGSVSTIAGNGAAAFADGLGTSVSFNNPVGVRVGAAGSVYVGDYSGHRIRVIAPSGAVSTLTGSGVAGDANGVGTAAQLRFPTDIAFDANETTGFIVEQGGNRIRSIALSTSLVSTLAGSGVGGFADGVGTLAMFLLPTAAAWHPSGSLYVAESCEIGGFDSVGGGNHRIRRIDTTTAAVSTFAGNGVAGGANGAGTAATFFSPRGLAFDATFSTLFVAEAAGNRIRAIHVSSAAVETIAGNGFAGFADGFGAAALFGRPIFLAASPSGTLYTVESTNNRLRALTCVPCPASYFCASGAPELCPAGAFCPLSSINPTPCAVGTFSAPGASSCAPCPTNTSAPSTGSTSCQPCPAGTASLEGSPTCSFALTPGAPCAADAACPPASACRGGFCCAPNAVRAGCAACAIATGACQLRSPGDPCASNADCGTDLCAGGCCCASSALLTPGCTACRCWANASTTPATAGACLAAPLPPPPPTCACAPSSPSPLPLPNTTLGGGCLACEAFDASHQVDGLFILAAANPLNKAGVDLALGLPGACTSLQVAAASQGLSAPEVAALLPCLRAPAYLRVEGVNYTVLGPAAPLRLAALPEGCDAGDGGDGAPPPPAPAPFPCSAPAGSYCAAAAPPATRCASVPSTAVPWATAANPASPLPCTACTPPVAIPLSGLSSPLSILATGGAWGEYGGVVNSFPLEGVATAPGRAGNCVVGGTPYPCFYMEEAQVCPAGAPAGACCNLNCGSNIDPGLPFVWSFAGPAGALLAPPRFGPVAGGVAAPPAAAQVLLGVNDLYMADNVGAIIVCVQGVAVLPCPAGLRSEAGSAGCA